MLPGVNTEQKGSKWVQIVHINSWDLEENPSQSHVNVPLVGQEFLASWRLCKCIASLAVIKTFLHQSCHVLVFFSPVFTTVIFLWRSLTCAGVSNSRKCPGIMAWFGLGGILELISFHLAPRLLRASSNLSLNYGDECPAQKSGKIRLQYECLPGKTFISLSFRFLNIFSPKYLNSAVRNSLGRKLNQFPVKSLNKVF